MGNVHRSRVRRLLVSSTSCPPVARVLVIVCAILAHFDQSCLCFILFHMCSQVTRPINTCFLNVHRSRVRRLLVSSASCPPVARVLVIVSFILAHFDQSCLCFFLSYVFPG